MKITLLAKIIFFLASQMNYLQFKLKYFIHLKMCFIKKIHLLSKQLCFCQNIMLLREIVLYASNIIYCFGNNTTLVK